LGDWLVANWCSSVADGARQATLPFLEGLRCSVARPDGTGAVHRGEGLRRRSHHRCRRGLGTTARLAPGGERRVALPRAATRKVAAAVWSENRFEASIFKPRPEPRHRLEPVTATVAVTTARRLRDRWRTTSVHRLRGVYVWKTVTARDPYAGSTSERPHRSHAFGPTSSSSFWSRSPLAVPAPCNTDGRVESLAPQEAPSPANPKAHRT
jgi:hypothetical protein